jgi:Cys-rich repeat protein
MAYTQIVSISAPSSAAAGEEVEVTVRIKNIYTTTFSVACIAVRDTVDRFIDWETYNISPGSTHSFTGSFIMPDSDCEINVFSYYYGVDGYWHYDTEDSRDVDIAYTWVYLGSVNSLSIQAEEEEPEEEWHYLGVITSLGISASQTPDEWHELGELTDLELNALPTGGWIYLGQLTGFSLTPGGGVEPPQCTVDSDCPSGYVCVNGECVPEGEVEDGEGEFPWVPVALLAGAAIVGVAAIKDDKKKNPTRQRKRAILDKALEIC